MQVVCLIHDLGKVLYLEPFNLPQELVVGDTYPVGCAFSPKIVYHHLFAANPDKLIPSYSSESGIYHENCGLENVLLSFGHDEFLYNVVKRNALPSLPSIAMNIIRYHSFYAWHTHGAYHWMMNDTDRETLEWVKIFNKVY